MDKEYFQNKFRTSTIRMGHWNYSWPGLYYVTICTKDRICCFGNIKDGQVYMSEIGTVVFDCWLEIPNHFGNVKIDDWIIMPNHLHGVIVIEDKDFGHDNCRDAPWHVSTVNKFAPLPPKSLPSIVNHFKGAVKRICNKNNLAFTWQERYYEHVIRDYEDLGRVREYIAQNPINWEYSKNNPKNFKQQDVKINQS